MMILLILTLWALLLVFCWPVAILVLLLWPVVWLVSIPFRLVGAATEALLVTIKALFFLPARLLGHKAHS